MPDERAWGYARVSTNRQWESQVSVGEQGRDMQTYAMHKKLDLGDRILEDPASSFHLPFFERPGGRMIKESIQRGDHLIIAKLDRGFRDTVDALTVTRTLIKRGVTVHILDILVDTSTPVGEMILTVMAAVAQFESRRRSERMRDAHASAKLMGRPMRKYPPPGFRWVGTKLVRRLVPCEKERHIMRLIWEWYDEGRGSSLEEIVVHLAAQKIYVPSRAYEGNVEYTYHRVRECVQAEAELREIEAECGPLTDEELGRQWFEKQYAAAKAKKKGAARATR